MLAFASPLCTALTPLQTEINHFVFCGDAPISRFEQCENSSIVFRGNPLFKREKGWHST